MPLTSTPTAEHPVHEDWTRSVAVDPTVMRSVMGAFPTGVTIVTTTLGGRPVGMTVSSFTSVSLDPPLLLVCVARTAGTLPAFRVGRHLAVNVLSRSQASLARRFASRVEDRFEGVDHVPGLHGAPLLAGTSAWVSGYTERIYDAGDHVILLIRAVELHRSEEQPLLYHSGTMHDWVPPERLPEGSTPRPVPDPVRPCHIPARKASLVPAETASPPATAPRAPAPEGDVRPVPPALATDATAASHLEPFGIPEMVDRVVAVALEKAHHPRSMLVRALIGGAMVAFGVILSVNVSTGITVPGIASLVMGLAFGFSFVLILVSGASLITADMAAGLVAVLDRRLGVLSYLRFLALGLVGNLAGALALIGVAAAAGGPYLTEGFARRAAAIGTAKAGEGPVAALLLAVLCTWFLQTAMFLFFKARTDVARMGFAFYGPFAFVAAGTQHVIANIAFIGLPLLLAAFHPGQVLDPGLTWGLGEHGMLRNLALTTVGNFVGGALLVAVPFRHAARLMQRGL